MRVGAALLLSTIRPRPEIDGLCSRENVQMALSTHSIPEIIDPLRFYLDFVRTPADYSEEQLAAELNPLLATALRPAVGALSLEELSADPNLCAPDWGPPSGRS